MQSSLKMDKPIFVSISCITYNHEKFIRQCIEGFLMQKTNFPIEILIFDDASTDGAQQIIQEYASKDHRIITFLQNENQWSKGKYGLLDWLFPAAKGKYIALCEGDDYWTDPLKLQKQVDFLEANEDFTLCAHQTLIINENNTKKLGVIGEGNNSIIPIESIIMHFKMHWSSFVLRSEALEIPNWFSELYCGDHSIAILTADKGKVGFINETMSAYRRNTNSITHSKSFSIGRQIEGEIKLQKQLNEYTNYKYINEFNKRHVLFLMMWLKSLSNIPERNTLKIKILRYRIALLVFFSILKTNNKVNYLKQLFFDILLNFKKKKS